MVYMHVWYTFFVELMFFTSRAREGDLNTYELTLYVDESDADDWHLANVKNGFDVEVHAILCQYLKAI